MMQFEDTVARWGIFELAIPCREDDARYANAGLTGVFSKGDRQFHAAGFYDGKGAVRIRFMPDEEGVWSFLLEGSAIATERKTGEFLCLAQAANSRGPVQVIGTTHFAYADGKAFIPFGTTVEAWHLQSDELRAKTLRTLAASPFNKARMSMIPQTAAAVTTAATTVATTVATTAATTAANTVAEASIASPFAYNAAGEIDANRYNPLYFDRLEACIASLEQIGVQAELVLLPGQYAACGGLQLTPQQEERYLRYAVSRLSAYSNVWWTMADLGDAALGDGAPFQDKDWRPAFRVLRESDYGHHLCTIHGTRQAFDWGMPSLTHISLRHEEPAICSYFTLQYEKPVILDHVGHEGTGPDQLRALTADELVSRVWEGLARGGYVTHGESLSTADGASWSTHGGELQGESIGRIAFLQQLLTDAPDFLTYSRVRHDVSTLECSDEYYLPYFGAHRCTSRPFLVKNGEFAVDLIDTWNMTIERLGDSYQDRFEIKLPGKLYYALRLQKVRELEELVPTDTVNLEPALAVDDGD